MWNDTHGARRAGRAALLLAAIWQLAGCSNTYRSIDLQHPFGRSESDLSASDGAALSHRFNHLPLYGPPASAAAEAKANQFSVSNPRVDRFVEAFQTRSRNFYRRALERGSRYLPKIESVLREENVPEELAYLPLIESGYRTQAVSHAGAAGPWQFIPATGRRYGLRIDQYVDERRDPVKSTYAAARYLKDLYAQFGDWHLSLAAYNTGEMNVARALERGQADDYWEITERGDLARETCDFVPQFLAAVQIAQAPEAYGFQPPAGDPFQYDLVRVNQSLSLKTVARLSNSSVSEIAELNPALHRGVTPPHGYTVRVPKGTKEVVEIALSRMRHEAAYLLPSGTQVAQRTHKMRKGETLGTVAKRHGVSVRNLMKANGIRNPHRVASGAVLRIPGRATAKTTKQSALRVASRRGR